MASRETDRGVSGVTREGSPGTGADLASVGRKLKYDIHYVDRMSFSLDARIYIATILLFLRIPSRSIARIMRFPYEAC